MSKILLVIFAILAITAFAETSVNFITADETEGMDLFSNKDEVSLATESPISAETLNPPNGATLEATEALNVRNAACTSGGIIVTLQAGARVTYQNAAQAGCGYTWYKVSGSFGTGWAASNWLRVVGGNGNQRINERGLNLVKSFEGLRLCKYKDPVGIWTICYGHTGFNPNNVNCMTEAQCVQTLRNDIARFETCVNNAVKVALNSNRFSALVSFSFNVGCGALQGSTLLRILNQGNYGGVCTELKKWVNGGGRRLPGLVRRRDAECVLFNA
jgi:lysozyme